MGLTAQQEAFAQALASGETQAEAYRIAYPRSRAWKAESVHEKASVTAKHVKIQSRIAELRAPVVEQVEITLEERIEKFTELARLAREAGDLANANRAEENITRIAGLFSAERPNDRSPVEDLTAAQRRAVRATIEQALARAEAEAKENV